MVLDEKLLQILACPKCKKSVQEYNGWIVCQNSACGLEYPIKDGIPVMLIQEAKKKN